MNLCDSTEEQLAECDTGNIVTDTNLCPRGGSNISEAHITNKSVKRHE